MNNAITGATVKTVLGTITSENIPDTLWELLPDSVAGTAWREEIVNAAGSLADWFAYDDVYDEDNIADIARELADTETSDYDRRINERVQALSLWAIDELDEQTSHWSIAPHNRTLNGLNSIYLFCALEGLFQVIGQWAINTGQDVEEVA
jgi:hypothetical protein